MSVPADAERLVSALRSLGLSPTLEPPNEFIPWDHMPTPHQGFSLSPLLGRTQWPSDINLSDSEKLLITIILNQRSYCSSNLTNSVKFCPWVVS